MHRVSILVLSLLGIADAWYLFQSAVTDTALSCDIGGGLDGCNIVAKSVYSHLFGVPLALYGVGFFACICILSAGLLVVSHRYLNLALYVLTAVGALASVLFLGIQFFLIKAICVYCLASAGITFLMFFLAHTLWKRAHVPVLPLE